MADLTTVRAAIAAALDEADTALNQPTVTSQLTTLQSELDAANATIATLQAKIAAARTAAQADKDADAATVAGQGVLDALA